MDSKTLHSALREGAPVSNRAPITGITGPYGSYLTELLMVKDYEVHEITPGFPGHKDKPSISKEVSKDMAKQNRILVTRAGGFIGHHVVKRLKANGQWVRPA